MQRGDVYDARLDPVEGSEQAGTRPVIIVSRDTLNSVLRTVTIVSCTTYTLTKRQFPTRPLVHAPDGGLTADSLVSCEQVRTISKTRLLRYRGSLSAPSMATIDHALRIALDLL